MRKLTLFLLLLAVVAVAGFGVFLAQWDIPPPQSQVIVTLPDERFPK